MTIYGSALVIALILDIGFVSAVALLMIATLLYDYFGGLTAVVISDVVQLALRWAQSSMPCFSLAI